MRKNKPKCIRHSREGGNPLRMVHHEARRGCDSYALQHSGNGKFYAVSSRCFDAATIAEASRLTANEAAYINGIYEGATPFKITSHAL